MERYYRGQAVRDKETGALGKIVHVYDETEIRGILVAVMFDVGDYPVAVHVDDIIPLSWGRP